MYYLQSRYYDSEVKRFVNADTVSIVSASLGGLTDKNLFSYVDNNPVTRTDSTGYIWETIFDIIGIGCSAYDLVTKPSWANIGFLAWDISATILPVVPGSYSIKGLKTAGKAESMIDLAKSSNKAPIVIGENMKRVKKYAKDIGGKAYNPKKTKTFEYNISMNRNKRWINDVMSEGRDVIEIGPDFARRRTGYGSSSFYNMERMELKNYSNYHKAFMREGNFGGLPGEW